MQLLYYGVVFSREVCCLYTSIKQSLLLCSTLGCQVARDVLCFFGGVMKHLYVSLEIDALSLRKHYWNSEGSTPQPQLSVPAPGAGYLTGTRDLVSCGTLLTRASSEA
jgi:hypothetical protein